MRLSDYLRRTNLSFAEFARRIGTPHARTVERYAKGIQRPNAYLMVAIARVTDGAVTPNDFFDLPYLPERLADDAFPKVVESRG